MHKKLFAIVSVVCFAASIFVFSGKALSEENMKKDQPAATMEQPASAEEPGVKEEKPMVSEKEVVEKKVEKKTSKKVSKKSTKKAMKKKPAEMK